MADLETTQSLNQCNLGNLDMIKFLDLFLYDKNYDIKLKRFESMFNNISSTYRRWYNKTKNFELINVPDNLEINYIIIKVWLTEYGVSIWKINLKHNGKNVDEINILEIVALNSNWYDESIEKVKKDVGDLF